MGNKKIGIIGSGMIGGTFGTLFSKAGHSVMFSSRHPGELKTLAKEAEASAGTVEEACGWADLVLLAVPFKFVEDLGERHNQQLKDKILIDASNPYPDRDGDIARRVTNNPDLSASEITQTSFSDASVVKAFNATYFKVFQADAFKEDDNRLAVPVAGDDASTKETIKSLIEDIGMASVDFGDLKNGRLFQPGTPPYNVNISLKEANSKWNDYVHEE